MNRLFPVFFLFIYVVVLLQPLFPLVDYAINKEYIAKEFCENKAKVTMHCNGKCHLMKEMKKAAGETPRNHTPRTNTAGTFLPHYSTTSENFIIYPFSGLLKHTIAWTDPVSDSPSRSVFHPPQC